MKDNETKPTAAGKSSYDLIDVDKFFNAGKKFPGDDHSIDVCLMATVLHDFVEDTIDQEVLHEAARTIKPNGILAIMEFKKIDGPPGPPRRIRLSPEQVDDLLTPFGFKQAHIVDVGPYNYLGLYKKT